MFFFLDGRAEWDDSINSVSILKDYVAENNEPIPDVIQDQIAAISVKMPFGTKWLFRIPDPMITRFVVSQEADGFSYIVTTWDVEKDAPDTEFQVEKSGYLKP